MPNRGATLLALALVALVGGCSKAKEVAKENDEPASVAVTHYTRDTELFVEFPPLARGQDVSFTVHLTKLADFKPVSDGKVIVTLSGGGLPDEHAESAVSDTAGIFKPSLKPQHAGKRRLMFEMIAPVLRARHDIGEVEVFGDSRSAAAAAQANPADSGIRYTKEQQWRVEFAVVEAGERVVRESLPVTARIRPRAAGEARISAPAAGILRPAASALPQIGSRVSAGQIVGYLLPRLGGETDIATLELAASRARFEAEHAGQELARLESLLRDEVVAEKRVREARLREKTTNAELAAAQRRLSAYQGGGGGIALKSPVTGTVVAVAGNAGAALEEGQTIFHIADLGLLWLEAQVPESDLGRVATPEGAFFKLDGEQQAIVLETGLNARLVAFGGMVTADTRTVPAIFEFENPAGRLKAGMLVRAGLFTGRKAQGVALPANAIVDDSGQSVVFVQKGGETFERRVVTPGARDGDWVAIRSGIAPGERVVARGAWQVRLAATAPAQAGHGHSH